MIGIIIGSEDYDGEPGVGMWRVLTSDGKLVLKSDLYLENTLVGVEI